MIKIAVVGRRKAGKTTLVEMIVRRLSGRFKIFTLKRAGELDLDVKGKDTWRMYSSGSVGVLAVSPSETFLRVREVLSLRDALDLVERLAQPDVVLIEGFKREVREMEDVIRIIIARSGEELDDLTSAVGRADLVVGEGELERAVEFVERLLEAKPGFCIS